MCFWNKHGKEKYFNALKMLNQKSITELRKNVKILVVDDADDDLYEVLKERQYNVYYKSDMTYALEAEPFDIILLDIRGIASRLRSNMEGFALACEIKKAYPLKKVCCYSGSIYQEISGMLAEKRIDAFFQKDLEIDKIAEKVDGLIEEYVDYEKQWDVLYYELRKNKIDDDDILEIHKAYLESFKTGNVSRFNNITIEKIKNGTVLLNVLSAFLSIVKVVVV